MSSSNNWLFNGYICCYLLVVLRFSNRKQPGISEVPPAPWHVFWIHGEKLTQVQQWPEGDLKQHGMFFFNQKNGEANPPENKHDNGKSPFLIGDMHFKWLVFHRHVSFLGCNCTQTKIHNRNGGCTGYICECCYETTLYSNPKFAAHMRRPCRGFAWLRHRGEDVQQVTWSSPSKAS